MILIEIVHIKGDIKMWKDCKGEDCKYCKVGRVKINSSLVMPNTDNNGVYLHHTPELDLLSEITYSVLPKS